VYYWDQINWQIDPAWQKLSKSPKVTNRKFVWRDRIEAAFDPVQRGRTDVLFQRSKGRRQWQTNSLNVYTTRMLPNTHNVEYQCFVIVEPAWTTAKRNNETANGRVLREDFPFLCCHPRFLFLVYPRLDSITYELQLSISHLRMLLDQIYGRLRKYIKYKR